jgi:hypothetical protein
LSIASKNKESIEIAVTVLSIVTVAVLLKKFVFSNTARLKIQAKKDLRKWKGKTETSPDVSKYLVDYWKKVGVDFSEKDMQSSSVQSSYPWSSAYIGHLIDSAGYKNFNSKSTHSAYVVEAKGNRDKNLKKSYWAFKPSEGNKVQIGDVLVQGRAGTKPNLDTLNSGVLSHGDIVVDIIKEGGSKYAILQGGNVSNTVKRDKTKLKDDGTVLNTVYFAQLKYVK